jgi:tRNA A37 threonylcarbamoyladenosine dehydratase
MSTLNETSSVTENPATETPIPMQAATAVSEEYRLHRRMDRMARLVGDQGMERLQKAHVMVIGLGGVGSWAAESLARAGVGKLSLVDFDQICITNTNRQLHALAGMVGRYKAEVLAERFQKVNPSSTFVPVVKFYNAHNEAEILGAADATDSSQRPDFVIDAIDNVTAKCHLLATCVKRGIPVVSCTGSGGRMDPLSIRMDDLSQTEMDPLARSVRKILRDQYGFPREGKGKFKIPTVYSVESPRDPMELKYDNGKGFKCVCPQGQNGLNDCDMKNLIMGNAGFLTGTFGNVAASYVVKQIIGEGQN